MTMSNQTENPVYLVIQIIYIYAYIVIISRLESVVLHEQKVLSIYFSKVLESQDQLLSLDRVFVPNQ